MMDIGLETFPEEKTTRKATCAAKDDFMEMRTLGSPAKQKKRHFLLRPKSRPLEGQKR